MGCVHGVAGSHRCCSTDASPAKKATSPKIDDLVEQIAALSLLEAAELTDALKVSGYIVCAVSWKGGTVECMRRPAITTCPCPYATRPGHPVIPT